VHVKALRALRLGIAVGFLIAAPAHAAPTVVSLQFDDGVADQWGARDVLAAHGMHATFFVNSGRPGKRGFLTYAQLHQLETDGNEIGGHTIDHVDLPTLGPDDQKREVCDDRADLIGHGFTVTDFAYPFGSFTPDVERVVQGCGYNSARITSGIRSPNSCQRGCPAAETIAPADPFATRTPDSVHADTPLAELTADVEQARAAGGGLVQFVMHHVCDGCNPNAISQGTLGQFLDYLASTEGVQVSTVRDVIGATLQPVVQGPLLPLPFAPTNLLQNPSLEQTDAKARPTCWTLGGAGTSNGTWAKTNDSAGGTGAETLSVTSLGPKSDRKLVTRQDTGTCAPKPVAGHRYRLTWFYRSSAPVRPVAYLRSTEGGWKFWAQGPTAGRATSWRQAMWTTPKIPAGTAGISVGVSLRTVGTMTLDNLLFQDTLTPLPPPPHAMSTGPETTRRPLRVKAGRLPVLVYGRVPAAMLADQLALQRHLATVRRAGFHPVGARALARVLAGRSAGVRKPIVIAFTGGAIDSLAIADWLLRRDGTRGMLVSRKPLGALADASRWDVVSRLGRIRGRATRIRMTFRTTTPSLLRALRAAGKTR
jgi:peptidoglycan/xylan/chitin deacetylase (PgdA/CDA1 family)